MTPNHQNVEMLGNDGFTWVIIIPGGRTEAGCSFVEIPYSSNITIRITICYDMLHAEIRPFLVGKAYTAMFYYAHEHHY
jgi:hypothetical protein